MGVSMKVFEKNCTVRVFFMNEAKSCVIFEQEDFHRLKHKVMMAFEIKIFKYNYQTRATEITKCSALEKGPKWNSFQGYSKSILNLMHVAMLIICFRSLPVPVFHN